MIQLLLLLLCLLPVATLQAQPGGGIGFLQLYGREGRHLVPLSWTPNNARAFDFGDGLATGYLEAAVARENYAPAWTRFEQPMRLLLIHQADTMVPDVDHLLEPNGAGYVHELDSLVILPGYFHYADTVYLNSFTPHTVATMLASHQLTYRRHAPLTFLTTTRLGASYYLALSRYWLLQHQPDSALTALRTVETRQPGRQRAPIIAGRRARAYELKKAYPTAIHWVRLALTLTRQSVPLQVQDEVAYDYYADGYYSYYYLLAGLYRQRQHLHLLQHDYHAALADYDTLAVLQEDGSVVRSALGAVTAERALFLADSLHESAAYGVAADLLRRRLPVTPAPAWPCERRLQVEYRQYVMASAPTYFLLGVAEYRAHRVRAAFQHWRLAMVEGQAHEAGKEYVAHFDSLLLRWPQQPLLWLGRAVAHMQYTLVPVQGGQQAKPGNYAAALRDLTRAEQLGCTEADLYYYQALVYQKLNRWQDMRRRLDLAIRKAPRVGELYLLRNGARAALKQARWNDPADPDIRAYHQLCPVSR